MHHIISKTFCKQFWEAAIDDVKNNGCTEAEIHTLITIFEQRMKKLATIPPIRKAWFEMEDFSYAKKNGVASFSLMIERKLIALEDGEDFEQWIGTFTAEGKSLIVTGVLENE